ncbi:hypothetical protein C8J57DRAFT_1053099 [Mycena rebaudengoi]|nr:hypothetical protein C8J57DRAFT_1053099 [Mycena rebaudengoi]
MHQPPVTKADLTGKTICVLGANTGIGFEAIKHFVSMNPGRIIMACRSQARGQEAVAKIKAETGYDRAELWIIDLADVASVKRFRDQFEKDGGQLDILVGNAAVEPGRYIETKDGWESTLQVNHLAMSLAVLLLLPTLIRTGQENGTVSRIVLVSSELHYDVVIEKKALANPGGILQTLGNAEYLKAPKPMREQYSVTKLLNVFFVRALSAHLGPSAPVVVTTTAPGFCVSELRRDLAGGFKYFVKVMEWMIALTTEEGSRRVVWACVGLPNAPDKLRGQYLDACKVQEASDFVINNPKVEQRLWDETMSVIKQFDPQVNAIAQKYLGA